MIDFISELLFIATIAFLTVSLIGFLTAGLIFLIIEITDKILDKKRSKIRNEILDLLEKYCLIRSIPISYEDEEYFASNAPDACGRIIYFRYYTKDGTTTYFDEFEIHIRFARDTKFTYITLAHEIGHYISVKKFRDGSEEGADYEASKLVRSLVDQKTQKLFNSEFRIFFHEEDLKNYLHKENK